jgi:hypothetical protein
LELPVIKQQDHPKRHHGTATSGRRSIGEITYKILTTAE